MRFTATGPSIPNRLIELRDEGEVIFFCGAGVSKPAGLPGFYELTLRMMRKLGVTSASQVGQLMASAISADDPSLAPPLDQVFSLLQRDYTLARVQAEVRTLLKTPPRASAEYHRLVLTLSSGPSQQPFVVTTNFDRLFERARMGLRLWIPPVLPPMNEDRLQSGVVYLHGRLHPARADGNSDRLVLGSGDFGRAYLADGWATDFVRQLMERKVLVFLGYSANDPPIRYLLEGLANSSMRTRGLYAFDRGDDDSVGQRWAQLGVEGIAFKGFDDLWSSLRLWANLVEQREGWTNGLIARARNGPTQLQPFERGQVAALVSTVTGARRWALAKPPAPAEWLWVFDRNERRGPTDSVGYGNDRQEIDPLREYGLDDDPPRPPQNNRVQPVGVDIIGTQPSDGTSPSLQRLAGTGVGQRGAISRRLAALAGWFESVAHQPAAIAWASKQLILDGNLWWGVERRLSGHGAPFDDLAQHLWSLLWELRPQAGLEPDLSWYDLIARVKRSGWTGANLRFLEAFISPQLRVSRLSSRHPLAPPGEHVTDAQRLLRFEVRVGERHHSEVTVSDDSLLSVFQVLRRSLERGIALLKENLNSDVYFHLPAISAKEKGGQRYLRDGEISTTFGWAIELFGRLKSVNPDAARHEVAIWPNPDGYVFDKMRLFAWSGSTPFSAQEIASSILQMTDRSFTNPHLQRELLHLLLERWKYFSSNDRKKIEQRIRKGRERYANESLVDYRRSKIYLVASRLGWLESQGCNLGGASLTVLSRARLRPDWRAQYEEQADDDTDGRAGAVERRTEPGKLIGAPLSQVGEFVEGKQDRQWGSFVEEAPFAGLVRDRPRRALAALGYQLRQHRHDTKLWEQLLADWPSNAPRRAALLCALRLTRLPDSLMMALRYYVASWIEKYLPTLQAVDGVKLSIWDAIFDRLVALGPAAAVSGVGETRQASVVRTSLRTLTRAINSPFGDLAECLFKLLPTKQWRRSERFPDALKSRVEKCLAAPGEGRQHAICVATQRLNFLYFVDPRWVTQALVPELNPDGNLSEAAWNGVFGQAQVPQPARLFALLKAYFIVVVTERQEWLVESDGERHAGEILALSAFWGRKGRGFLTAEEGRTVLQKSSEQIRSSALWMTANIVEKEGWSSFGRYFVDQVWPQETSIQNPETTRGLVSIADAAGDAFPEAVTAISSLLRPLEYPDLFVYRHRREGENSGPSLSQRFPHSVLHLADAVIGEPTRGAPYELGEFLQEVADADPAVRELRSWRRLRDIVDRH